MILYEVEHHAIPPKPVINLDQTGSKLILVSQWKLAEQGCSQVTVVGKDDKRDNCCSCCVCWWHSASITAGKTLGYRAKITTSKVSAHHIHQVFVPAGKNLYMETGFSSHELPL